MDDITKARWQKEYSKPREFNPTDALEAAKNWINKPENVEEVKHIIVCVGWTSNKGAGQSATFFQAGDFPYFAQMGLLAEMQHYLREQSDD